MRLRYGIMISKFDLIQILISNAASIIVILYHAITQPNVAIVETSFDFMIMIWLMAKLDPSAL